MIRAAGIDYSRRKDSDLSGASGFRARNPRDSRFRGPEPGIGTLRTMEGVRYYESNNPDDARPVVGPVRAAVAIAAPVDDVADHPLGGGQEGPPPGAATSNITPWLGEGIVGNWKHAACQARPRRTGTPAAWCSTTAPRGSPSCWSIASHPAREVFDEAKRQIHEHAGLAADHVLMAATHPFRQPAPGWGNAGPDKDFSDYQRFVARRISDGARARINATRANVGTRGR